jgi:hypothetical protein
MMFPYGAQSEHQSRINEINNLAPNIIEATFYDVLRLLQNQVWNELPLGSFGRLPRFAPTSEGFENVR